MKDLYLSARISGVTHGTKTVCREKWNSFYTQYIFPRV